MSKSTALTPDPSVVFEDMVLSTVFEPRSASIEEKRLIFGKAWAESFSWLQANFDLTGKNSRTDSYGFGFLVEAFVRYSGKLPRKNTERGERAARAILSELHSGKNGKIDLGQRQSNSDFLWVDLTGRRITIMGIGEVKSSYLAASQKVGGQLARQSQSLNLLVEGLRFSKTNGSLSGFFQKRGVSVSDKLERFLIVPYGEGERARCDKNFSNWQVIEIEFSYNELIFIAQQVWPNFRSNVKIGPGRLTNLFYIATELGEWVRSRLDEIFCDSDEFGSDNPLPYFELGLFFLATGKTPLLEDEVTWSAELVRKCFWPAVQRCLNLFANTTPCSTVDFSEKDRAVIKKFWHVLTSNRGELEYFVYFIKSLNKEIQNLTHSQHQIKQLKSMSEVWNI